MSGVISGQVVPGAIRKQPEQTMGGKPIHSTPPWSQLQFPPPGSFFDFLVRLPSGDGLCDLRSVSSTDLFTPELFFVSVFIMATEKPSRISCTCELIQCLSYPK